MNKIILLTVGVLLLIGIGIFSYFSFFVKSNNPTAGTYKGDYDYTIELSDYSFNPNTVEVSAGTSVKILLTNKSGTHDFVIDEFGLKSNTLSAGQEQLLTFRVPESSAGQSYEFYCSQANHRSMGMVGTIKIN